MPEHGPSVLRIGSYGVDADALDRLIARHGAKALELPAGGGSAVRWALRQAALRALAAPPRVAGRWRDVDLLGTDGGPYTLIFRGEVARFAETVLRGDISLSVTTGAGRVTAHAVMTRGSGPARPSHEETEVCR
ncbi:hypothetical protein ACH46N_31415 [Streptomyces pristinaespiralis]|jgi:phosphopantetheinyl transferase (holo-ACP synthase)|uniref:Predicted protein n=2 Tax=Streptomyces pristinaespiralis TaxID=38300 RepID=D6X8W7_STRE2|nr:hypothetical protein [Streptomyces pristinaespiralis]ALC21785.1 hypothetical protein SPRI_3479 [Streptomyces pristinaespiralis]EFH31259.1 predicted protein [Streptomyces pristinaespiralis ATCC 25486]QMU15527.1 hypothetical protein H3L99_19585 [Streptomyces pristinaespiralis]